MMRLAVYYHGEKVTNVHGVEQGKDFAEDVLNYNRKCESENRRVEIKSFDDDSLEAVLYAFKEVPAMQKKDFKEQLKEIVASIDSLVDEMRWLRRELEDMNDDNE